MITIIMYGLDQFVVGEYSKEATPLLANAFETQEDEINFCAPSSMIFHKGVEQTSWHGLVVVIAPTKFHSLEKTAAEVIKKTLTTYCVNFDILFNYVEDSHIHSQRNKSYPAYILEENVREREIEFSNEMPELGDDECHCGEDDHECHCDEEGHECHCHDDEEIYLGNAFEGLEDELDKRK